MRQRLSPRETVVVVIFGTTTAEGEAPSGGTVSGGTVDPAAASCGCCALGMPGPLDAAACRGPGGLRRHGRGDRGVGNVERHFRAGADRAGILLHLVQPDMVVAGRDPLIDRHRKMI